MNPYLKIVSFDVLDLGKEYLIHFGPFPNVKHIRKVKFIKTTAKGYNFLDIETNKCILKRHLYKWNNDKIVLHKSLKITSFEIRMEQGIEKFINLEPVIK